MREKEEWGSEPGSTAYRLWFLIVCHVLSPLNLSTHIRKYNKQLRWVAQWCNTCSAFKGPWDPRTKICRRRKEYNGYITLSTCHGGNIYLCYLQRDIEKRRKAWFLPYQLWTRTLKWIWEYDKSITVEGKHEVSMTDVQPSQPHCCHGPPFVVTYAMARLII